jgi:uncharacterized protein
MVHLGFIWNGDILTLYAVCGLLLIPFVALSRWALLALAAGLLLASGHVDFGLSLPSGAAAAADIADARRIYGSGGTADRLFRTGGRRNAIAR